MATGPNPYSSKTSGLKNPTSFGFNICWCDVICGEFDSSSGAGGKVSTDGRIDEEEVCCCWSSRSLRWAICVASSAIMAVMLALVAVMVALMLLNRQSRSDSCSGEKAWIASCWLGEMVVSSSGIAEAGCLPDLVPDAIVNNMVRRTGLAKGLSDGRGIDDKEDRLIVGVEHPSTRSARLRTEFSGRCYHLSQARHMRSG